MKYKNIKYIRNNIYLCAIIIVLCVVLSFVLAFLFDESDYTVHANIYNGINQNVVSIDVTTDSLESAKKITENIANEAISSIHSELDIDVNKSISLKKSIDVFYTLVRGLIVGLIVSVLTLINVFVPKAKIESEEDINEIFGEVPILASIPEDYIDKANKK